MPLPYSPDDNVFSLGSPSNLKLGVWNRLEPRPRKRDFSQVLSAPTADALWMLTRQWQMGEFKGEDASTAITTRLEIQSRPVARVGVNGHIEAFNNEVPLEARIEAEPVPFDLKMHLQVSAYWRKLLKIQNAPKEVFRAYQQLFPLEKPDPSTDTQGVNVLFADRLNNKSMELADLEGNFHNKSRIAFAAGYSLHAELFLEAITNKGGAANAFLQHPDVNTTPAVASNWVNGNITDIDDAGISLMEWLKKCYFQPSAPAHFPWDASHLEYTFQLAIAGENQSQPRIALQAKEYYQGQPDWFVYEINDLTSSSNLLVKATPLTGENTQVQTKAITLLAAKTDFPGMPVARWWEFENGKVNFAKIEADTTDLAAILFTEFSLLFSNDWNIVPVSVPAGSLSAVQYIIVNDSFGFRTRVDSAVGNADDLWSLVSLNKTSQGIAGKTDPRLFLPPIAFKTQEGNPIEQVLFLRDEMANLVWGVEKTIPGIFGEGTDGYQAYLQRKSYLSKDIKTPASVETENGATYRYEFMTTVPENWIPFIPALTDPPDSDNPDIRLLRGKMLRDMPGVPEEVKPRGVLLTEQPFPFYVFEEEVPREGAQVTRSFQRTRWWNGKVVTWIGRRKRTGRGEGSSGLAFDQLIRNSG